MVLLAGGGNVTSEIYAYSAAVRIPQTGQTTCSSETGTVIACAGTGQDGELKEGVAWPNPRFIPMSAGTGTVVTDKLTGLVWTQDANAPGPPVCGPGTTKTWQGALDYVACLNRNSYLGYVDWRLPNRKELKSLVNYGQFAAGTWLNTQGFTNVQVGGDGGYWSSTSVTIDASYAWGVDMSSVGGVGVGLKTLNIGYVWPVRAGLGGAPADQPKTGQTICYNSSGDVIACTNTGQDGELQKGVVWPNPRFTNPDNSTPINGSVVIDQLTGLMWTRDGNAPGPAACTPAVAKTWQGALNYAACLNANSYLGYVDWRLPDANELESLVNADQSNTATWLLAQGFTNAQNKYWSSTSFTSNAGHAYFVDMYVGDVDEDGKTASSGYSVWPVRGQSGSPILPGDCDGSGKVSIAEVQAAINMYLGLKPVAACVDTDHSGTVSIAEVQKVINGYLGL